LSLSRVLNPAIETSELLPIEGEQFLLGSYTISSDAFEPLGALPFIPTIQQMGESAASGDVLLGAFWLSVE
jgi:hypothetical protein